MFTSQKRGIQFAVVAALISGISIFINKFAVDAIKQPLIFTAVKNSIVAILILGVLLATKKWQLVKKLSKRQAIFLMLIGIVGGSLPFYLFFTGLAQIPAINAALIQKTLVLWVTLLAIPFLKEKLSKKQIVAILILFGSNLVIGGFKGFQFSSGEFLVLIATILWAIENILAKKILPKVDPDLVTAARMGFGALILTTFSIFTYPHALENIIRLNFVQWGWITITAITLFGYVISWYRALKFAPATIVTAILVGSTLITNILSAIFITHVLTPNFIIQLGLVIFGILFLVSSMAKNQVLPSSRKKDFLLQEPSKF